MTYPKRTNSRLKKHNQKLLETNKDEKTQSRGKAKTLRRAISSIKQKKNKPCSTNKTQIFIKSLIQ